MASTLPPNILSYIGTFIKEKDQRHCALVCKHWTEPFLNAYWGKLKISNDTTDIITLISNKASLINAHRVWAVEFSDVHLYSYERLLDFQLYFPGIRCIEFYDFTPRVFPISDALEWSLWQSLTHISISFNYDSETASFLGLFTKLSVLPCLVHLIFLQSYDPVEQSPISWNDFESLHYHLPRLEYLNHNVVLKLITREDIENIKTVEPAQTMTKIYFYKNISIYWLFYFALKYPNLQHLIIGHSHDELSRALIKYMDKHYQPNLQLFSTLDQFFPCLKKVATNLQTTNLHSWAIFFENLRHFGTKIEHFVLGYERGMRSDDVNRCIHPISESLKFLKISLHTNSTMRFDVCPRLVTLYIYGNYKYTIKVNQILKCFPALHSLSVNNITFSLSPNTRTYTPHPLQKLTIKNSYINNAALHYLSLRCNQLKHVTITGIDHDKVDDETGQLIFDMSVGKLDTFIFTFCKKSLFDRLEFPRHYMLQQMENDNNGLQATKQPYRINWYHVYCDRTNRKPKLLKWELGRRDIEFCQRYLKDFDRRRKRERERKDIKKHRHGYIQRRFWKKDLQHGVLIFRFKSVKNCIFRIEPSYSRKKFM